MTSRSRRGAVVSLLALLLVSLLASSTSAQAPTVAIERTGCTDELGRAVEAALGVELSDASPEARRALADGSLRIAVQCDDAGATAWVLLGPRRLEQRIDDRGPGAARRLAIALGELLGAAALPEAPAEPTEPRASAPDATVHPPDGLRARLRASGGAWLGGVPLLALGTLDLGIELGPSPNVAIVVDASGALGSTPIEGARLDARLLGAAVSLRFGGDVGDFWLGAGPAMRGGAVFWTGVPTDVSAATGHTATGGWLGLGAVAAAFVRIGALPLRAGLEIEGGGVAYYADALAFGMRAQRIGDAWVELRVALDVVLE